MPTQKSPYPSAFHNQACTKAFQTSTNQSIPALCPMFDRFFFMSRQFLTIVPTKRTSIEPGYKPVHKSRDSSLSHMPWFNSSFCSPFNLSHLRSHASSSHSLREQKRLVRFCIFQSYAHRRANHAIRRCISLFFRRSTFNFMTQISY